MADTMTRIAQDAIELILEKAYADQRLVLYEHEVYAVLAALDLHAPAHAFIRSEADITSNLLAGSASGKIVLKVVSKDITHKQQAGGVQIVHKDLEFIRYSFLKMKTSIASRGYAVEGILLVDFENYSQDLGNEILLGFRESDAFGPVLSFSKGGADAEHFAKHFSSPNLILAPIDRKWAQALLESTKINQKYCAEGKGEYVSKIVDAGVQLSALAAMFSNFFETPTRFSIKEFEINPFVFNPDGGFIALDGFARFELKAKPSYRLPPQPPSSLTPFFEPKGIAIVGISTSDPIKPGNIILKNLLSLGREDVFGVNKNGGHVTIQGHVVKLHRSLADIEAAVDLAIIAVPAEHTLPIVNACACKGVKAIVLIPGGFSEIHKDMTVEDQIAAIAKTHHMRIIGPNCLGLAYAGTKLSQGVNTFFIPEEKFSIQPKFCNPDFHEKNDSVFYKKPFEIYR